MAVKKEPSHVFEYFKTSEVFINGRFKEYVDKMWVQNKVQESMVKRLVDLYAVAISPQAVCTVPIPSIKFLTSVNISIVFSFIKTSSLNANCFIW